MNRSDKIRKCGSYQFKSKAPMVFRAGEVFYESGASSFWDCEVTEGVVARVVELQNGFFRPNSIDITFADFSQAAQIQIELCKKENNQKSSTKSKMYALVIPAVLLLLGILMDYFGISFPH